MTFASKFQKYNLPFHGVKEKFDPTPFYTPDTPELSYMLGFIWGDGYLEYPARRLRIVILREDMVELEPYFTKTGAWKFKDTQLKQRKPTRMAYIGCKELLTLLAKYDYNIKSGASACKILDKIPDNLKHYWWRGYFDADGWFNFKPHKKYSFGIAGCFEQNWDFVIRLFEQLNIKFYISQRRRKNGNSSEIHCTNYDGVLKFASFIYQNYSNSKMGLSRKYNKFLAMKEVKENI